MMFQPEHIEQIRTGEKTQTRRDWSENYAGPSEGSVIMATPTHLGPFVSHDECDCYIRVVKRWREPLIRLSESDADAEGGYTRGEFFELWSEINESFDPMKRVDAIEFEYVGRSRDADQSKLAEV